MKYLKISNDGLLDIRLIYLMGGTTKANDQYKIGQFGTGLKYTLAYLLRNNLVFQIYSGGREIEIHAETEVIRDTEFDVIYIDGQKSAITTMVGREWEAWMIVREIYCNALDEENSSVAIVDSIESLPHTTEFYIQFTGEIQELWANWKNYFIHDVTPLQSNDEFAIYPGGDGLRFYKKGVLIHWDKTVKSVFSYDFKGVRINELREYSGSPSYDISNVLPLLNTENVEYFLSQMKGKYEDGMDYDWYVTPKFGQGWENAIGEAKIIDYDSYEKLKNNHPEIDDSPIVKVPKGLFGKLMNQFPKISMLRASRNMESFYEVSDEQFSDKIHNAIETLLDCGYSISNDLKIITGVFGNSTIIAQINKDEKEISLSMELAALPLTDIMKALIEENEHYLTGYHDCSRQFQNHFISLFLNQLTKSAK